MGLEMTQYIQPKSLFCMASSMFGRRWARRLWEMSGGGSGDLSGEGGCAYRNEGCAV